MSVKAFSIFTICYFLLNTSNAQSVASEFEKTVQWGKNTSSEAPYSLNFALSDYYFDAQVLPCFSENFITKDRAQLEFYDLVYEPISAIPSSWSIKLKNLKGEAKPVVKHT
ncbi:MAG: hypothetical protein ACKOXF_00875, partial [Chitinophagaceae bacterium]